MHMSTMSFLSQKAVPSLNKMNSFSNKFECQKGASLTLHAVELQFLFTGTNRQTCFQHGNAPVHKASSMKTWFAKVAVEEFKQSAWSKWTQPHLWYVDSQGLYWNWSAPDHTNAILTEWAQIPKAMLSKSSGRPSQKSRSYYSSKGEINLERVQQIHMGVMVRCDGNMGYITNLQTASSIVCSI